MKFDSAAINSLLLSRQSGEAGDTAKLASVAKSASNRRPDDFQEAAISVEQTIPDILGVEKEEGAYQTKEDWQECDPKYDPDQQEEEDEDEDEADIGILSCGTDRRCVADEHSSLGGICVPTQTKQRRMLYDGAPLLSAYCDGTISDPQEELYCTLDCSQFDVTSGTGVISCSGGDVYCFGTFLGELLCGNVSFTYDNSASTTYPFYEICYDFVSGSPPFGHVCIGSSGGPTPSEGTCTAEVNNVECTCQPVSCTNGSTYGIGSILNCPGILTGNTCDEHFDPFSFLADIEPVPPGTTLPPSSAPKKTYYLIATSAVAMGISMLFW